MTAKKFGFVYKNVGIDSVPMGDYGVGEHSFEMAPQQVPSFILAAGAYRIKITYSAENHDGPLRFEDVPFHIH